MSLKMIKNEIMMNKKGIIVGAATGLFAAYYAISHGADVSSVASAGKGLLDTMMSRSAPMEVATTKIYVVFGIVGAAIGYLADKYLPFKKR